MLEQVGQGDYLLPRANSVGRGRERGGERRGERRDGEETVREEKWGRKRREEDCMRRDEKVMRAGMR